MSYYNVLEVYLMILIALQMQLKFCQNIQDELIRFLVTINFNIVSCDITISFPWWETSMMGEYFLHDIDGIHKSISTVP